MPRKIEEASSRIHLLLFDSDIEWIKSRYGVIGVGPAVRAIVRKWRRRMDIIEEKKDKEPV